MNDRSSQHPKSWLTLLLHFLGAHEIEELDFFISKYEVRRHLDQLMSSCPNFLHQMRKVNKSPLYHNNIQYNINFNGAK